MTSYAWDAILPKPRMPEQGETVNGQPFVVPGWAQAMTIHVPSLGGATLKLQSLDPATGTPGSEVFRDVKVYNLSAGGVQALSSIAEDQAVTIPTAATGAGVLRFVASADQSASPVYIPVVFSRN